MRSFPVVLAPSALLAATLPLAALPPAAQVRDPDPHEPVRWIADSHSPQEEEALAEAWLAEHADAGSSLLRARSHLLDDVPISVGPLYKAVYPRGGVTFTPLLGRQALQTRTMTWRLESASIGDVPVEGIDQAAIPILADGEVRYERGALAEVYLARDEGLEQLFVFDALPSRTGDLVVRGHFETDLQFRGSDASELRFEEPGIADVRIGKIVGVDARGRRAAGELRLDGESLEMRLPAAFVAEAALPLVLDPLLEVETLVSSGILNADQPDVAYGDSTFDEYAVVFCRYYSLTDPDITAGFYRSDGTQGMALQAIEADSGIFDQEPSIAYNAEVLEFAVAWTRSSTPTSSGTVRFVSFNASNGATGADITVASSLFSSAGSPDVGGESIDGFSRVLVAYERSGSIRAASISLAGGVASVQSDIALPLMEANCSEPATTKDGGVSGNYLVVCERQYDPDRDLVACRVDFTGSTTSPGLLLGGIGPDESQPDVAGGDDEFFVAYTRNASVGDGDGDVRVRKITWNGQFLSSEAPVVVAGDLNDDEHSPAIGRFEDRYLLAYVDEGNLFSGDSIWAVPLDEDCSTCEPADLIGAGAGDNAEPEVGSQTAAGEPNAFGAMIAFARELTLNTQVWFELWESLPGSSVAYSGGGCGDSGDFSLNGDLSIGGTGFTALLSNLGLSPSVAVLNLGAPGGEFGCDACTVLPLQTLITVPTTPEVFTGQKASVDLAIPCKPTLAGETLALQWIVLPTSESPCSLAPNLSLSDRLLLTLGF